MQDVIVQLKTYLAEVAEPNVTIRPDRQAKGKIPVFMGQAYEVFQTKLLGRPYTLLLVKAPSPPTPSQAAKHAHKIRALLGSAVVFVFPQLPAFERKRYILQGIAFIVPRRQIYLPMVLMDLRESASARTGSKGEPPHTLSAPAQVLLLFYLQKPDVDAWSLKHWAQVLGYSTMTLTRARNELVSAELCLPQAKGRSVELHFSQDRSALWQKALPYLRTPVQKHSAIGPMADKSLQLFQSGITALAYYTLINADPNPVYALSAADYRRAVKEKRMQEQRFTEENSLVIERWRYAPALLATDKRTVDRLSLYLSLRNDPDERIQDALHTLLENVAW